MRPDLHAHSSVPYTVARPARVSLSAAAAQKRVVRVADEREFPEHTACEGQSRRETVVPVFGKKGEVSG